MPKTQQNSIGLQPLLLSNGSPVVQLGADEPKHPHQHSQKLASAIISVMSLAVSVIPIAMLLMAGIVVFIARRPVSAKKAANWPTNEATIRTVRIAYFGKNTGNPVYVGDFSYITGGEYYSGTLAISSSFSTGDGAPGDLVNQKIQVRYNPRKPKQFWVPQQEIRGFLLDPYMNSI